MEGELRGGHLRVMADDSLSDCVGVRALKNVVHIDLTYISQDGRLASFWTSSGVYTDG